jgi:hypothetical protein
MWVSYVRAENGCLTAETEEVSPPDGQQIPANSIRRPTPEEIFFVEGVYRNQLQSDDIIQLRTSDGHYVGIEHNEDDHHDYVVTSATVPGIGETFIVKCLENIPIGELDPCGPSGTIALLGHNGNYLSFSPTETWPLEIDTNVIGSLQKFMCDYLPDSGSHMGLANYGVLIGNFNHFEREPEDNYGNWYHGFIFVNAIGEVYRCAVDVYKPDGGFQFMLLDLEKNLFTQISALPDGYHELLRYPMSGAIDYIRSPIINQAEGCLMAIFAFISRLLGGKDFWPWKATTWMDNTGDNALNNLKDLVSNATRLYVFGAPFHNTNPVEDGMHDVHMNQGDPPGQFQRLDGIWQDGCVIVEKPGGMLRGYFGKFETQSLNTDDHGLPI